jgi:hypothetical protein
MDDILVAASTAVQHAEIRGSRSPHRRADAASAISPAALRTQDLSPPAARITYDAQPEFSSGWRASVALTVPRLPRTHRAGRG